MADIGELQALFDIKKFTTDRYVKLLESRMSNQDLCVRMEAIMNQICQSCVSVISDYSPDQIAEVEKNRVLCSDSWIHSILISLRRLGDIR